MRIKSRIKYKLFKQKAECCYVLTGALSSTRRIYIYYKSNVKLKNAEALFNIDEFFFLYENRNNLYILIELSIQKSGALSIHALMYKFH